MRIRTILMSTAAAGAALALSTGPAMAGEVTGSGKPTNGPAHSNSICAFSGLQDGDGDPTAPARPGVPPQNWGHTQQGARAEGATMDDLKAAGLNPGQSCNGHSGWLVNPPGGTP
jgi:hypothetical protein